MPGPQTKAWRTTYEHLGALNEALRKCVQQYGNHQRIGQIIQNAVDGLDGPQPFYVENDALIEALEAYAAGGPDAR